MKFITTEIGSHNRMPLVATRERSLLRQRDALSVGLSFLVQGSMLQFFQQRLHLLQILRVKPFAEPVVDLG
jgi:hypothetical protein